MNQQQIVRLFPNLLVSGFSIESPETICYNCIAWAAEDTNRVWWPDSLPGYYWPNGTLRAETLESFTKAFGTLGYSICQNSHHENGFKKIAIYTYPNGKPTHAARQLSSGRWTSKLGRSEDIEHALDGLSPGYGSVAVIMKKHV